MVASYAPYMPNIPDVWVQVLATIYGYRLPYMVTIRKPFGTYMQLYYGPYMASHIWLPYGTYMFLFSRELLRPTQSVSMRETKSVH